MTTTKFASIGSASIITFDEFIDEQEKHLVQHLFNNQAIFYEASDFSLKFTSNCFITAEGLVTVHYDCHLKYEPDKPKYINTSEILLADAA